jgi:Pyruvate/2-oxoacid:ferredoxin oxidoreductase delta subunit
VVRWSPRLEQPRIFVVADLNSLAATFGPRYCITSSATMSNTSAASLPSIDANKCTDCRECIPVCPRQAIFEPLNICCAKCVKYCMTLKVDCRREKPTIAVTLCDGCGLCLLVCPVSAITWNVG